MLSFGNLHQKFWRLNWPFSSIANFNSGKDVNNWFWSSLQKFLISRFSSSYPFGGKRSCSHTKYFSWLYSKVKLPTQAGNKPLLPFHPSKGLSFPSLIKSLADLIRRNWHQNGLLLYLHHISYFYILNFLYLYFLCESEMGSDFEFSNWRRYTIIL